MINSWFLQTILLVYTVINCFCDDVVVHHSTPRGLNTISSIISEKPCYTVAHKDFSWLACKIRHSIHTALMHLVHIGCPCLSLWSSRYRHLFVPICTLLHQILKILGEHLFPYSVPKAWHILLRFICTLRDAPKNLYHPGIQKMAL